MNLGHITGPESEKMLRMRETTQKDAGAALKGLLTISGAI